VTTTNTPGRPRVDPADRAPSVYAHVTLNADLYDRAYAAARRERLTMPEFIRLALRRELARAPDR
jgi:hypothetical protein